MVPELGGAGGGGQFEDEDEDGGEGGGDDGGEGGGGDGGGGDGTWPHGLSQTEHISHSICSLEITLGFGSGEESVVVATVSRSRSMKEKWA